MNAMIEAIIFDFGNVIARFDRQKFLSQLDNKRTDELERRIYGDNLLDNFEKGLISGKGFYKHICTRCHLTISYDNFLAAYTSIFIPIQSTIDLILKLKPYYKLGLLSNTNEIHYEQYISRAEIFPLFDAVTVSHKVQVMKPDRQIYNDVLGKLQLPPQQCVFIDDLGKNVLAANALGLHAHQYTTHEKLMYFLQELGVHV